MKDKKRWREEGLKEVEKVKDEEVPWVEMSGSEQRLV